MTIKATSIFQLLSFRNPLLPHSNNQAKKGDRSQKVSQLLFTNGQRRVAHKILMAQLYAHIYDIEKFNSISLPNE